MARDEIKLSRYLCDSFTTVAFFANSYAVTLRIIYDVLRQKFPQMSDEPLEGVAAEEFGGGATLSSVLPNGPDPGYPMYTDAKFVWPDALQKYFFYDPQQRSKVIELKHKNESARRVLKFLISISRSIRSAAAKGLEIDADDLKATPLLLLEQIDKAFKKNRDVRDALRAIRAQLPKRDLRTERSFRAPLSRGVGKQTVSFNALEFDQNAPKVKLENHSVIEMAFNLFLAHADAWLVEDVLGTNPADPNLPDDVYHPLLPGLRIYQPALRRGLLGTVLPSDNDSESNATLISIVREARGSVTNTREDVNLLVRDLLWLRPFSSDPGEAKPVDEKLYRRMSPDNPDESYLDQHGGRIGLYYSAIDGLVYEVKRFVHRDNIIMIDGVALMGREAAVRQKSKSFCMYLPKFEDNELDFTMGTLMGGTKNNVRTGAWTVIGMRPLLSDEATQTLSKKLCMYADSFEWMTRDRYDRQIGILARFIEATGLVGVLHSRAMLQKPELPQYAAAAESIGAFRDLFRIVDSYKAQCDDVLEEVIGAVKMNGSLDEVELRERLLALIEQQNSYAIAPVAVFKSDIEDLGLDPAQIRSAVRRLSRLSIGFRSYEMYAKAVLSDAS